MENKKNRHGLIAETSCRMCLVIPKTLRERINKIKCQGENFSDATRACIEYGLSILEKNK